jgi:hypothetical protein
VLHLETSRMVVKPSRIRALAVITTELDESRLLARVLLPFSPAFYILNSKIFFFDPEI